MLLLLFKIYRASNNYDQRNASQRFLRLNNAVNASLGNEVEKKYLRKVIWKNYSSPRVYLHTGELIYRLLFLHLWDIRIFKYNIVLENHVKNFSCYKAIMAGNYNQSIKIQMKQRWTKEGHILHRLAEFFFVFHKAQTRQLSNCHKSYTQ